MPSEAKTTEGAVTELLRDTSERFHSAVAATIEQVRAAIAESRPSGAESSGMRQAELGSFATGRIAVDRFSALFTETRAVDASRIGIMEQAFEVLRDVADRQDEICRITVGAGQSLYAAVGAALADVGRAFGATRVFELCRSNEYRDADHATWLRAFPHARWTEAERAVAPPICVTVNGVDCRVGALADFLDGQQKIVLVVRGAFAPAPLAHLITPRRYVVQAIDVASLDEFRSYEGPGIAAIVPRGSARFRHDPRAGERVGDRLTIDERPESVLRKPIGGLSPSQQREQLAVLDELSLKPGIATATVAASASTATSSTVGARAAARPAERLAAWLLNRADLSDLG
ncbi:MAG: hypothetical protein KDC38_04030 [Planctomycetes bacterium]|nr:hypothetical protein [Planctomycetota bacterium]